LAGPKIVEAAAMQPTAGIFCHLVKIALDLAAPQHFFNDIY
jgi:hypothetical protein